MVSLGFPLRVVCGRHRGAGEGRDAASVAPVDKLSVVFAIALAAVFLGESLSWHHWVGGGLIVAGAIVIAAK